MNETTPISPDFKPVISSPDVLSTDNDSILAEQHRERYKEAKGRSGIIAAHLCSDARANLGSFTNDDVAITTAPSIAAAAPKDPLHYYIDHNGVGAHLVLQHHDGGLGLPFQACGGLGVKAKRINHHGEDNPGVEGYVDRYIHHHDAYIQAIHAARQVAAHTQKSVFAGSIDHSSGLILPFAIISEGGRKMVDSIFTRGLDQAELYQNGTAPILEDRFIPDEYLSLLDINRRRVQQLQDEIPDLERTQKTQNPPAIIISTSTLPAFRRYPHTFGRFNSHFGIRMPFFKLSSRTDDVEVRPDNLKTVINQAEYPIAHSAVAGPGESFSDTHVVLIETPNITVSQEIADRLVTESWMQAWLAKRDTNQVWVAQVQHGITQDIQPYAAYVQ